MGGIFTQRISTTLGKTYSLDGADKKYFQNFGEESSPETAILNIKKEAIR
jgi:hypothetical protein